MLVQPPQRVKSSAELNPPLAVRIIPGLNPQQYMAFLSVTDETGKCTLSPPRNDIIAGNLGGSTYDLDPAGVVTFPGVKVLKPGRYRLCVQLLAIEPGGPQGGLSGPVRCALSRVFTVET